MKTLRTGHRAWPSIPTATGCPSAYPCSPLKAKYQATSSAAQTLSHQEHVLSHLPGHLGDSVPTVCTAVLRERLVQLGERPGWAAGDLGRSATGPVLWEEDRANETPRLRTFNCEGS